ncbi:MAG: hypothetical protein CM15mV42_0670 [uncultured marine virus]|nr:MAG: hypothetical protein CM15mV42_0670 [uncultured marine virus]
MELLIRETDTAKYGIKVIQYPYGYENMPPGHIEAVLYDKTDLDSEGNPTYKPVNEITAADNTKLKGHINRWPIEGNKKVDEDAG